MNALVQYSIGLIAWGPKRREKVENKRLQKQEMPAGNRQPTIRTVKNHKGTARYCISYPFIFL
jgi:hypothetical protein